MPEYGTSPLWLKEKTNSPFYNIRGEELKLSPSLIEKIKNWDFAFQNTLNEDYPPDSGFVSKEAEATFEHEGIRIWEMVSLELPTGADVVYYSVIKNKLYNNIFDILP
jgi:hypothetical protein